MPLAMITGQGDFGKKGISGDAAFKPRLRVDCVPGLRCWIIAMITDLCA
jgi:hypothetical protein